MPLSGLEQPEAIDVKGYVEVDAPFARGLGTRVTSGNRSRQVVNEAVGEAITTPPADHGLMQVAVFGEAPELIEDRPPRTLS